MWSPPSAGVMVQWDEEPFVAAKAFEVASPEVASESASALSGKGKPANLSGLSSPETEATATPSPHGWSTPSNCFSSSPSVTSEPSLDEKDTICSSPSSTQHSVDEKDQETQQQAETRLSVANTPKQDELQQYQSSEDEGSITSTTASSEETVPPAAQTTPSRQSMVGLAGVLLMLTSTSIGAGGACVPARKPAKPASAEDARTATKLVAKCVQLLLSCGYPWEDVELVGAQASSYMERLLQGLRESGRPEMELMERAHVLCLLMYVAHSYVEDEHCPGRYWHQRLFREYCDMKTMNAAILSLLQNLDYKLLVEETELNLRLSLLRKISPA